MRNKVIIQILLLCVTSVFCDSKLTKSPDGNKKESVFCMTVTSYEKTINSAGDDIKFAMSELCSYQPDNINVCCDNSVAYREAINKFRQISEDKHRYTRSSERESLLPKKAHCGKQLTERIFGGDIVELDEFPWLALLEYKNKLINGKGYGCGGSIINSKYILTAAHCITGANYERLGGLESIWLGEYNTNEDIDCIYQKGQIVDCNEGASRFTHETIIPHPDYGSGSNGLNDIALVRVNEVIPYTDFIRPICLPTAEFSSIVVSAGQNYTVAGWGKTERDATSPIKLKVIVPIVDHERCAAPYKSKGLSLNASSQICAGGVRMKDSCTGDSGGPLMSAAEGSWYTIGVVSLGSNPCAQTRFPAVYTSVQYYLEWIENTLEP